MPSAVRFRFRTGVRRGGYGVAGRFCTRFLAYDGRFNAAFERRLGDFLGRKHVLTVNSGSSANLVAFASMTSHLLRDSALRAGDEVITCATGFPTTVNPIMLYGMVPVFVDVDIPTYYIDPSGLEEAVTDKTRAIMVAHTLGNPFDLGRVMEVADRHDLFVIEDCCDALGARYDGQLGVLLALLGR